jgi:NAD(P)-dependent dehydrogenase (short-subunit alcohol dehydrogenase family)
MGWLNPPPDAWKALPGLPSGSPQAVSLVQAPVVWLASRVVLLTDPQSAYITGAVLPVDGGWTSH